MSFIDWNAGAEAGQSALDQQQYAQNQLQQTQQLRALSALRGVNVNDPDSLNTRINALAGLGMFDQAKAASDLYRTSAINQAVTPLVQEAVGNARQGMEQPSDQGQMDTEKHERLLTEANAALSDIMSTEDPQQRQQKAQAWKTHFANEGVPEDAIDGVIGDLSDQGLQGHQANIQRELTQYQPGYQQSKSALNSGLANPIVMGALGGAGVDVAPGLTLAANITSPVRGEQAQLAFAPGIAGATTTATNIANLNTLPAVQQAVSQASARGAAAGSPMEITMPDGSTEKGIVAYDRDQKPYFVPIGAAPAAGAGAGPPIASPSLAGGTGQRGGAAANVEQANAFEAAGSGAVVRKSNLDNLRQEAGQFAAGPQSGFWEQLGAIAAEYHLPAPGPIPSGDAVAAQTEFRKLATTILGQQRAALGLPATDQSTSITTGATPNDTLTPKGIARVAGILEGNEDYINAGYQAWTAWKNAGHGYETFQQFLPQWNKAFDPRVFQAQYMTPDEAAKVKASVRNYDTQVKVAKRLGYIAQ